MAEGVVVETLGIRNGNLRPRELRPLHREHHRASYLPPVSGGSEVVT